MSANPETLPRPARPHLTHGDAAREVDLTVGRLASEVAAPFCIDEYDTRVPISSFFPAVDAIAKNLPTKREQRLYGAAGHLCKAKLDGLKLIVEFSLQAGDDENGVDEEFEIENVYLAVRPGEPWNWEHLLSERGQRELNRQVRNVAVKL